MLEPIFLGLLVAPSPAGAYLALACFAAFLTRQPLRLALADWRDTNATSGPFLAERFGLLYTAMSAVASSFALAGGWPVAQALALRVVLVARAVPSVLYVRARLRLGREETSHVALVLAAHIVSLALVVGLAVVVFVILLVRAVLCLSLTCTTI